MNKIQNKKSLNFFGKSNYILMIAGAVLIIIGMLLMAGGKSTNPDIFNNDEVNGFRRITLAPIVIIAGFLVEIFAIFKKS